MKVIQTLTLLLFITVFTPALSQESFDELDKKFHYYLTNNLDSAWINLNTQERLTKNREEEIKFNQNKAFASTKQQGFKAATLWLDKSKALLKDTDYDLWANHYKLEAALCYKHADFRGAINKLFQARPIISDLSSHKRGEIMLKLANAYFRIGSIDSAHYFVQQALDNSTEKNILSENQKAGSYSLLGQMFLYKSEFDSSFIYHHKALEIYEANNNTHGIGVSFAEMAGVKLFQKKLHPSLGYYKKAIIYFKALDKSCLSLYANMGSAYSDLGELDSAEAYLQLAHSGAAEIQRYDIQANAAGSLGNIYSELQDYDKSITYFTEAMNLFKMFNHDHSVALCEMALANGYAKTGKFELSDNYLKSAERKVDSLNNDNLRFEYYTIQYELKSVEKDYKSALIAFQNLTSIKDTIQNSDNEKKIEELEIRYNTKWVNRENEQLKIDANIKTILNERIRYIYILAIILLIGILLVFFFANLSAKRKLLLKKSEIEQAKLKQKLLMQNLTEAKNAILSKNQLLTELERKLTTEIDYTEVSKKLLDKISLTQEWAEFTIEFNALYHNFFNHLTNISNSALTKNDLRLASLIKLSLSNKEIAGLLFISADSVKKAKNRLAKKLNLTADKTLTAEIRDL